MDWIGRWDDLKAAAGLVKAAVSAFVALVVGAGGWLMANWKIALTAALVVFVFLMLFLPVIAQEVDERRFWQRYQNRKERRTHPALRKLAKKAERVAEGLQEERLDTKHENVVLFNRNRKALRKLAGRIDELGELRIADIEYPDPRPPQGRVWRWEAFLAGVMQHVAEGEPDKLATVYQGIREALAKKGQSQDLADLLDQGRSSEFDAPSAGGGHG